MVTVDYIGEPNVLKMITKRGILEESEDKS